MAFPAIATTRANGSAVSSSDFTFGAMPTGTTSGDLLVAFGHTTEDNADYTDPSGWTRKDSEPGNTGRSFVWARVATGTDPLVFPLSALGNSIGIIVARITGWTGTDTASVEANLLADFSGNGDPPSITATWGSADNTFIAVCGREGLDITAYPTGYSGGVTGYSAGNWGAVALASKQSASATDNPGTGFSTGGGTVHVGTIVVRGSVAADTTAPTLTSPAAVATGNTTGTGSVSTNEGNGTLWRKAAASASTDPGAGNEAANGWTSSTVTATGAQTGLLFTGLTTNVAVVPSYFHVDAAGNRSAVGTGSAFTPSTMTWTGTYPNQSGVAGAAFVHSGSIPTPSGGIGSKTYSGTGLGASGLTFNGSTGQLQGTCGTSGTYTVTPTVTDSSTAGTNPTGGGSPPQTRPLAPFTLTITAAGSPPTVSANPSNLTVATGSTASFSAGFNGTPALLLQWQEFIGGVWTAMSGETAATLSLGTVTLLDTGRLFRLGCTNSFGGPIYTSSATLTVTAASVGTITTDIFAAWGNDTPIASTTIPFVTIEAVADATIALQLINQVTGSDGRLTLVDAAITPGDDYMVATRNADGTIRGYKKYTAT